jgi:hypothetical protein
MQSLKWVCAFAVLALSELGVTQIDFLVPNAPLGHAPGHRRSQSL